jgi:hypothetical protein
MATSSPSRFLDPDLTFFRGMASDKDPGALPLGYYWAGINVVNVGGMISCRPGYRCLVKLPEGKLQGATVFRPQLGIEQMLVCVDGAIYVAPWPFLNFRLIPNLLMSPTAKQIFWKQTTQTAERRTDDVNSAINLIAPRNVLFIQDGGFTAPAWYDGQNAGHIRGKLYETPVGGAMEWVGDRLWIANGNTVIPSDISNPFSFREGALSNATAALSFSGEVTALTKTPSLEFPQLIVFTPHDGSIVKADIRNRSLWPTTDGFQKEVFQVGCTSNRSLISHFGKLSWFSLSGVVTLDAAIASKVSARLPIRDNEMMVSKTLLPPDLSLVAGAAFGQYQLFSVPAEDSYNKHTWVMNGASYETLSDDSGPSWASYWLGTRPVEWVYGEISGAERIYHVSVDEDGENRLWECFLPERLDNGCPIMWAAMTRGYFGVTSAVKKVPGDDCRFAWADVSLVGVEENLDLGVFYAGGLRGAYKQILGKRISVMRGSLESGESITATSNLFAFKPQIRVERTQDANQMSESDETGSCPVEDQSNEGIDESFQLLVVAHGPGAIRFIRAVAFETPPDLSGAPEACVNEVPFNAIRFDGSGVKETSAELATEELALRPLARYTSNQTATVSQDGASAVGIGFSESVVSQEAADRVAEIIATKAAEAELNSQLPPVLSVGEGFDE